MSRLYMTVEGQTEQVFASQLLTPHLAQHGVFLSKPRLTGPVSRKRGRIPKGGMFKFFQALGDMKRWLAEDRSGDARFTMMVDLYGLPNDFPGYDDAMKIDDPYDQVKHLETALAEEINDSRFVPYLQLHEFEAIVLSQPESFGELFDNRAKATKALVTQCQDVGSPEEINHGETTHPAARILTLFPDYDKTVDGPLLAAEIGLPTIRSSCPHFDSWLTTLENLVDALSDE